MTMLPPGIATPPPGVPGSGPTIATTPRGVGRPSGPGIAGNDPSVVGTGPSAFDSINPLAKALNPLSSLADMAGQLARGAAWISDRHNWIRLLEILLGIGAVWAGVFMVSKDLRQATEGAIGTAALAAA